MDLKNVSVLDTLFVTYDAIESKPVIRSKRVLFILNASATSIQQFILNKMTSFGVENGSPLR